MCQADGGEIEPSKQLIEQAFLRRRRFYFGIGNWVRYEQNRESRAKL
jgi:hypothetical protein